MSAAPRRWKALLAVPGVFLTAAIMASEPVHRGALDHQSQPEATSGNRHPAVVWRFQAAGPVRNATELQDGVLYVPSADGHVQALDADSGLRLWNRDLGAAPGAPVAHGELLVVIDRRNRVHALNSRTGEKRWMTNTGADLALKWGREGWDYLIPAPAIRADVIFAGSGDGGLYALGAADGAILWKHQAGGRIRATPAVYGDVVYIGSGDGYFHALDAGTGEPVWRFRTEGVKLNAADFGFDRTQITGAATVIDENVYFGSRDARLYALDRRNGSELWRVEETSAWIVSSPAVTADAIYSARSSSANVRALDRESGNELWMRTLGGPVFASPVLVGDRLYVASEDGHLYAFDRATGRQAWSYRAGSSIWGTPIAQDGRIYFGSDGGTVYALTDHDWEPPRFAVFWDERLLPLSGQARAPEAARALVAGLITRGYQVLDRSALRKFLEEQGRERRRSAIVFAMDGLPGAELETRSAFHAFLKNGGKAVWLGSAPGVIVRDPQTGAFQRADADIPGRLLGIPFSVWNADKYPAWSTDEGKHWGLPLFWTASPTINGAGGVEVLATDEFGRPAAWARRYGGPAGSGFVYLGSLWEHAGACTIAAITEYGLTSGGFAAGAPACDSRE